MKLFLPRLCAAALLCAVLGAPAAEPAKVLRVAFSTAESGFDPVQLTDLYSNTVVAHIFEPAYRYDHLARPPTLRPLTADGLPDVSADFREWTVRLRPGTRFAADPAFEGRPRELVAQDYVYSLMRYADPALRSANWSAIETLKIAGLAERRQAAIDARSPFDYDTPLDGAVALDRYSFRIRLTEPNPRFLQALAGIEAMAREVVAFYGDRIAEHPVGTGPFKLKQWRRTSLIVLERNPDFRETFYDAQPAADDADGQAILAKLKGRRVPLVDEVRISIIEEEQPRWLSFLNADTDLIAGASGPVPGTFAPQAMPGGRIAPNLAKRGIQGRQQVNADIAITYFNMEDPVVGGYTPEKIALRRAIGLAMDVEREIRVVRRGQAIPAQSNLVPHTSGFDPAYRSEVGTHDAARAKALLDITGYVDRDGDGWREQPDGQPLVLVYATQPEQIYREFSELFRKNMQAVGLRARFEIGQWPEQLKQSRAGKLMIWALGSTAGSPDGRGALARLHGPQAGGQNLARFRLPEFDAIYERLGVLPDGPEREALFLQAKKLSAAYLPYKPTVHRIGTDLWHPWVTGFRRPPFWNAWWHLIDVDMAQRKRVLQ